MFTRKVIRVTFSLANGVFEGGQNSAVLTGLRTSVQIIKAAGPGMGEAHVAVYGMALSKMNQLTTLGTQYNFTSKNKITIEASEDGGASFFKIFTGTITTAWPDAQAMPDVVFRAVAQAGADIAVQKTEPNSYAGSSDVSNMLSYLAQKGGLQFENNGITSKLSGQYLWGSVRNQILMAARAAGVAWIVDLDTLAIWKPGQTRQGDEVLISPATGLVSYPGFNQNGVVLTTYLMKDVKPGGKIRVQSDFAAANGSWVVKNINYDIESAVPSGKWFSIIEATNITVDQFDG